MRNSTVFFFIINDLISFFHLGFIFFFPLSGIKKLKKYDFFSFFNLCLENKLIIIIKCPKIYNQKL